MFLRVLSEAKKDGPFFTMVGFICGVIQYLGYNYFDKTQLGNELVQEHIAFKSLVIMIIFLWFCSAILHWKATFPGRGYLNQMVSHISGRAVAFALVAAFVTLGVGFSALLFKSYGHAVFFSFASLYFGSLAELASSPSFQVEKSTCYWPALGIVIATPFSL